MQPLTTLTIDGQTVSVPPGTTVLEAARQIGIEIPSLCYYAKLSKLGACRVCLVEVERMKALQTACTTAVRPEMVVYTNKPEIIKARRAMVEFLLTNHPLDCPVCDKGGECELQELSFHHGPGGSRYMEERRQKEKALPLGPTVIMDQERCVLCRRCVRYLEEWADEPQLSYLDRGRLTHVGAFPTQKLAGRFVGNVVDLCPVGALTSRVSRFSARAWEFKNTPSICGLCGMGCSLTLGTKNDILRRIAARSHLGVNDEWLCDKGRFAYGFVHSSERVLSPLVRRDGQLQPASWEEALRVVGERLTSAIKTHGPTSIGGLGSSVATNEANYVFQRFMRGVIGTNNVDHVGRLPEDAMPLNMSLLAQADVIVLCGTELAEEAPVVELLLRHQTLIRGVKFVGIGPRRPELAKRAGWWLSCRPEDQVAVLNGLAHLVLKVDKAKKVQNAVDLANWMEPFSPQEVEKLTAVGAFSLRAVADVLALGQRVLFLYGPALARQPGALQTLNNLTLLLGTGLPACIAGSCNARGALDMGIAPGLLPGRQLVSDERVRDRLGNAWKVKLPRQPGLDLDGMKTALTEGRLNALYIMRSNPIAEAPGWEKALQSGAFLVVQDLFLTETAKLADVVLPAASYPEDEGTFTSLGGRVQRLWSGVPLVGEARTDVQILSSLAEAMKAPFGYGGPADVMREMARLAPLYAEMAYEGLGQDGKLLPVGEGPKRVGKADYAPAAGNETFPFSLVTGRLLYDGDLVLRQTPAFDELTPQPYVQMNSTDAVRLGITQGDKVKVTSGTGSVIVAAHVSADVSAGCVFLPCRVRDSLAVTVLEEAPLTRVSVEKAEEGPPQKRKGS